MIIVTGGAGFIGSNLAAALDARGERVAVIDWLGQDDKWRNIAKRDLETITRPENLPELLASRGTDVKALFHMGAISTTTETDADLIATTNVTFSQQLYRWCADAGVPFIYASSAATYGNGKLGFKDDAEIPALAKLRPMNAYGWSKHLFDRWVAQQKKAGKKAPPQVAGLKFFNVYGPNEYHKGGQRSVAEQIYGVAAKSETFNLFKSHNPGYADGGQLRDFIWVGDCVDVMLWLFDHPKVSGLFNCGTGKARSFRHLGEAVYRAMGMEPKLAYRDMPANLQPQYQYFTEADMTKLRAAGYDKPFTGLEEGVKAYVTQYLSQPDRYI